jgi:hypothetical protein
MRKTQTDKLNRHLDLACDALFLISHGVTIHPGVTTVPMLRDIAREALDKIRPMGIISPMKPSK